MICLKCSNEEFVLNPEAEIDQEFQGKTVKVKTPVMECSKCGWRTFGVGQLDELLRRTKQAFGLCLLLLMLAGCKTTQPDIPMPPVEYSMQ